MVVGEGEGVVLRVWDISVVDRRRMVWSIMVVPHLSHRSAGREKC